MNGKFLHVVVSLDKDTAHVITAYEPDPHLWEITSNTSQAAYGLAEKEINRGVTLEFCKFQVA